MESFGVTGCSGSGGKARGGREGGGPAASSNKSAGEKWNLMDVPARHHPFVQNSKYHDDQVRKFKYDDKDKDNDKYKDKDTPDICTELEISRLTS